MVVVTDEWRYNFCSIWIGILSPEMFAKLCLAMCMLIFFLMPNRFDTIFNLRFRFRVVDCVLFETSSVSLKLPPLNWGKQGGRNAPITVKVEYLTGFFCGKDKLACALTQGKSVSTLALWWLSLKNSLVVVQLHSFHIFFNSSFHGPSHLQITYLDLV